MYPKNRVLEEIKRKFNSGNACYFLVSSILPLWKV